MPNTSEKPHADNIDAARKAAKSLQDHAHFADLVEKQSPAKKVTEQLLAKAMEPPLGMRARLAEASLAPNRNAQYISQQTLNLNIHGPVAGVQTGSNNTMNVAQQVHGASASDIVVLLEQLRGGIATLPYESREEAEGVAKALEKQATSAKPSMPLVKGYAATLNEYLMAYAPVIATIVELCAKKLGG